MIKRMVKYVLDVFRLKISRKKPEAERFWSNKTAPEIRALFHFDMFNQTKSIEGTIVEVGVVLPM